MFSAGGATRFLVVAALLLWCAANALAACSGTSPTRTAASVSRADVGDCYAAAQSGDTIRVPAGTAVWNSVLIVTKDVTFIGGGIGQTNISRSGECFRISMSHNIRISGFSFTNCTINSTGVAAAGKAFRVDHNSFTAPSWTQNDIHGGCQTPMRHPTGLWDNNRFFNFAVHVYGTNCMRDEGDYQEQLWSQDPPFGRGTGVVYVEDNVFDGNNTINWMDGNYGGRYVARFNTITGGGGYLEIHSIQGDNRAVQMWEIYRNTMTGPGGFFGLAFMRAATGFVFGNRVPNGTQAMKLNNIRSNAGCVGAGVCEVSGACNGTSNWDQNTPGQNGYACRDQIGRGKDSVQWTIGGPYTQSLMPAYFWDNLTTGGEQYLPSIHDGGQGTSYMSRHIVQNRDWYTQSASFTGASGIGVGPISNRPATCTPGVGYWSTDQGEWNSNQAGPDGQLYACTAPNTWSLYYVPYTYPHPLQGAQPPPPPAPPTALSATVVP